MHKLKPRIELENYHRSHLDTFVPGINDRHATSQLYCERGWEGKAVSGRVEGRTVGIFGVAVVRGTAHVWLVLSDEIRANPITMSRWAMRSLVHIMNIPGVERVRADINEPMAVRWAEWLGFEHVKDERYEYGN